MHKNDLVDGFSLRKSITGILNFLCYLFLQCLDSYNEYVFLCNPINPTASLSEASLRSQGCRQHQGCSWLYRTLAFPTRLAAAGQKLFFTLSKHQQPSHSSRGLPGGIL